MSGIGVPSELLPNSAVRFHNRPIGLVSVKLPVLQTWLPVVESVLPVTKRHACRDPGLLFYHSIKRLPFTLHENKSKSDNINLKRHLFLFAGMLSCSFLMAQQPSDILSVSASTHVEKASLA